MDVGDQNDGEDPIQDFNDKEQNNGTKPRKKKSKIPHRKRFTHKKRHVEVVKPSTTDQTENVSSSAENLCVEEIEISEDICQSSCSSILSEHDYSKSAPRPDSSLSCPDSSFSRPSSALNHHDFNMSRPGSSMSCPGGSAGGLNHSISLTDLSEDCSLDGVSQSLFSPTSSDSPFSPCITPTPEKESEPVFLSPMLPDVLTHLLFDVRNKLILMLPYFFGVVVDNKGIHVLMLGRRESKAVQREIFVSSSGQVRIEVHGQAYPSHTVLQDVLKPKALSADNTGYFTDRIVQIVNKVRLLEICAGMDKVEFKEAWAVTSNGVAECDTYKECRYRETFRSKSCSLLVPAKSWRCKECTKLQPFLKKKLAAMQIDEAHENTNTRYLLDKQKDKRLASKQQTIKRQSLTIDRLQARIKELISREGCQVESELSADLTDILLSANLSVTHSLFLQQQLKAVNCKKSCGMRWHPTLIRLALSIYLKSPSAYKELSESGFIKLPTSRTLFDYSHVTKVEQGIDTTVLDIVSKQVATEELSRKQYHVLLADEMHISKNLVIQKSTGQIIGFTDLDNLDKEVKILDSYLDQPDKAVEEQLATKMLAFMVRGLSSRVKNVVASYPVLNPSARQMYIWTWEVIGSLEKSGVRVIAFTCDGAPSNRAFLKLHKPFTEVDSKVIFDTVNKFAPERPLFFFSDVPHLLKTIRNALFNSRLRKKGTRCLKKNGQPLVWDTIVRLYLSKKNSVLRKSYKLNAQVVFPDSYSKMKVPLAAAVISKTVANDVASQQWPCTSELVEFLLKTNNWFDLLNGAFSSHGVRTNNYRLNPYTKADIEDFQQKRPASRFQELLDYLNYLNEWKEEIASKQQEGANMTILSELGVEPLEENSFHALEESHTEDSEYDSKCLLPHQTLLGIEMSTRAFIGAVTFLLEEGISFVNARSFCQDPLEQNFGKQRQRGGGSSNPNVAQYGFQQRAISMIGQLAAAKRSAGNTEIVNEDSSLISCEPLPKRKCNRKSLNL